MEGMRATAYDAASGQPRWQLPIAPDGEVRQVRVSSDGRTCAVAATTQGGRVFILRDGQVLRSFPTAVHQLEISADGSLVAVTTGRQMKLCSTTDGLRWLLHGEDQLQAPRMAPMAGGSPSPVPWARSTFGSRRAATACRTGTWKLSRSPLWPVPLLGVRLAHVGGGKQGPDAAAGRSPLSAVSPCTPVRETKFEGAKR